MVEEQYLRLLPIPEEGFILLISNSGDCTKAAIEAVRGVTGVAGVELYEAPISDYPAPMSVGAPSQEEAQHEVYRYRIALDGSSPHPMVFAPELQTRVQNALAKHGYACAVAVVDSL